jgi:hypothetical protein
VPLTPATVAETLRGYRFRYANEDDLQQAVQDALARSGVAAEREARLDGRSRVDLLAGRVAIEVKVAGSATDLLRQLTRYARSPLIDGIVVVTNRARHLRIPDEIEGKPVEVVSLLLGAIA